MTGTGGGGTPGSVRSLPLMTSGSFELLASPGLYAGPYVGPNVRGCPGRGKELADELLLDLGVDESSESTSGGGPSETSCSAAGT